MLNRLQDVFRSLKRKVKNMSILFIPLTSYLLKTKIETLDQTGGNRK